MSTKSVAISQTDRTLLILPFLGGLIFGLAPLLIPTSFAHVAGYSGDDVYIYQLAGAATFGYAVVLWQALRGDTYDEIRFVVAATLTFNIVSLYACLAEIVGGTAQPIVYLILLTSIAIVAITTKVLRGYPTSTGLKPDVVSWVTAVVAVATVAAAIFGLGPLFPKPFASFFGYLGTDGLIYRQGGAATCGYAVMGILELRSRNWRSMRLPAVMGLTFNALGFLATLTQVIDGKITLLVVLVGATSLVVSILFTIILVRRGR